MINEFLARNDGGLRDGTGRASDWIEVFNAGDEQINLKGYHLTDSAQELTKWTFPDTMLAPNEYVVVWSARSLSETNTNLFGKRSGFFKLPALNIFSLFLLTAVALLIGARTLQSRKHAPR